MIYNGANIARPILPKTEVCVNESLPMTDSSSFWEMEPLEIIRSIVVIHVIAFAGGSLISSVILFEGRGGVP